MGGQINYATTDNHYLIIENKLDAKDQKHQITRYIRSVQEKYGIEPSEISEKIAVVYLSKNRTVPSSDEGIKSIIGFELIDGFLTWKSGTVEVEETKKVQGFKLTLKYDTKIPYYYLPYFSTTQPSIDDWIKSCKSVCGKANILYALDEYQLIMDQLNPFKTWKKIMSIGEFVSKNIKDSTEQKQFYNFMVESQSYLVKFVARTFRSEVEKLIDSKGTIISYPEDESEKSIKIREFTDINIENWLSRKGNNEKWENVGFIYLNKSEEKRVFILANHHLYISDYVKDTSIFEKKNKISIGKSRNELLNKKNGLYEFLGELKGQL